MLAEAIGCLIVLLKQQMLLGQTLFDFLFALFFGILLFRKANNKAVYFATMIVVTSAVFYFIYRPALSLSERIFICECGNHMDRDINAAINLREEAIRILTETKKCA